MATPYKMCLIIWTSERPQSFIPFSTWAISQNLGLNFQNSRDSSLSWPVMVKQDDIPKDILSSGFPKMKCAGLHFPKMATAIASMSQALLLVTSPQPRPWNPGSLCDIL